MTKIPETQKANSENETGTPPLIKCESSSTKVLSSRALQRSLDMMSALTGPQKQAKVRGDTLVAEAETRLKGFSLFGFFADAKHSDAAEKFKMAGNQYKLGTCWEDAGNTFFLAAEHFKAGDENLEYINATVDAAQCYRKDRLCADKAIMAFTTAIDEYNMSGRFSRSAQFLKEVAEIHESNEDWENAVEVYEQAAQIQMGDNKRTAADKLQVTAAGILADKLNDYARAAGTYLKIGTECMESNLGKFAAKGHFLSYLLCLTARGDCVALSEGIGKCKEIDYSFSSSRECTFLERLCLAMQEQDLPEYASACAEYDNITPLDPWKTSLLLRGRQHIEVDVGEADDGGDMVEDEVDGGDDDDLC